MSNTGVSSSKGLPRINQLVTPRRATVQVTIVFIRPELGEGSEEAPCRPEASVDVCIVSIGCPTIQDGQEETRSPV